MESPKHELMSGLATLLEAGKYSDLTIVCGMKRYAVHRAIICSRSGFFDGACSHTFREAETGIIDLSEDDPEAVEHMIDYFYRLDYMTSPGAVVTSSTGASGLGYPYTPVSPILRCSPKKLNLALVEDPLLATAAASSISQPCPSSVSLGLTQDILPDPPSVDSHAKPMLPGELSLLIPETHMETIAEQTPVSSEPNLLLHARVYALADKYSIMGLKFLAAAKFAAQVSLHFCCEEFAFAAQEVYDNSVGSDRGLRDVIVQAFRAHPELASRKDVEAVAKETPGLAWELFRVGWGLPVH